MTVQVWFAENEIDIEPGQRAVVFLTIENAGPTTQSYSVVPSGLHAGWVTVSRSNITVFDGSRDTVEISIRPPAAPSTTAGPAVVSVRVTPHHDPDNQAVAELTANIAGFDDRRIAMLQPVQRGRRRASYEFMVENHGNSLATCRLHLVDPTNRIDGTFDPPAVGIAPGDSSLVKFKATARGKLFRAKQRQLDFEIEATEPDHQTAIGRASLLQAPSVSTTIARSLVGLAAVTALVVGGWFAVIRPTIERAVDSAVSKATTNLATASPEQLAAGETGLADTDAASSTQLAATPSLQGVPTSYRIALDVGIGQEASDSVSLPPDSKFHLTDVVLQNLNSDSGTAQLMHNGDVMYEWDLGSMASANEFQPRVTAYPFEPTDRIVLSVQCKTGGTTTSTGCNIAVLLTGLEQAG